MGWTQVCGPPSLGGRRPSAGTDKLGLCPFRPDRSPLDSPVGVWGAGLYPHGEPAVFLVLFGSHLPGFLQPAGLGHSHPSEGVSHPVASDFSMTAD